MEFTGRYWTEYSAELGESVDVLEYQSGLRVPYCECSRCGKPITRKMYVVQSNKTGVELLYLGSDCLKRFERRT